MRRRRVVARHQRVANRRRAVLDYRCGYCTGMFHTVVAAGTPCILMLLFVVFLALRMDGRVDWSYEYVACAGCGGVRRVWWRAQGVACG